MEGHMLPTRLIGRGMIHLPSSVGKTAAIVA